MNHFIGRNHTVISRRNVHKPRPLSRRHFQVALSRLAIRRLFFLQILFHDVNTFLRVVFFQIGQRQEDAVSSHDLARSVELSLRALQ